METTDTSTITRTQSMSKKVINARYHAKTKEDRNQSRNFEYDSPKRKQQHKQTYDSSKRNQQHKLSYDPAKRRQQYDQAKCRQQYDPAKRRQQYDQAKHRQQYDPAKRRQQYDQAKRRQQYDPAKRRQQYDQAKRRQQYDPAKHRQQYDPAKHRQQYDTAKRKEQYQQQKLKKQQMRRETRQHQLASSSMHTVQIQNQHSPPTIDNEKTSTTATDSSKAAGSTTDFKLPVDTNKSLQKARDMEQKTMPLTDDGIYNYLGSTVCLCCDRFIIGDETVHKLKQEDILKHKSKFSVESYNEFYEEMQLTEELIQQYEVKNLEGLLLSPRARKYTTTSNAATRTENECQVP